MTRKSTLVLLIGLGVSSVVVGAANGGYWWWRQNGDALMAEARSAEAEGTWFQARFPDGVGATITAFAVLPDGTKTQSADVMGAQSVTITPDHVVHRSRWNGIGCFGYDVTIEPLNDAGFLHDIFSPPRFRVSFQPYSIAMPDQAKACATVSLPSGSLEPQTVAQGDVISLEMVAADARTGVKLVDEIRVSRP